MAKRGRPKKNILENEDLLEFKKFQNTLKANAFELGSSLTDKEKAFLKEFVVFDSDDEYDTTVKALKFKHYILHKDLTQDECSYFIDLDEKGTKPSKNKRLTKMTICNIEDRVCKKLKKEFGSKFNVFSFADVYDTNRNRHSVEPVDFSARGREAL